MLMLHDCAFCAEPTENRYPSAVGHVCSALCAMRAAFRVHAGMLDGRERVETLRGALGEGAPVDVVALEVQWCGERFDFHGTLTGGVVDADADSVTLEGEPFGECTIAWSDVVDAHEVRDDA